MELTLKPHATTTLMGPMTRPILREVMTYSRDIHFHRGDSIITFSSKYRTLHLVRAGAAKVSIFGLEGQEKILAIAGPGALIGDVFGCGGLSSRPKTVVALTPTVRTRSWRQRDLEGLSRRHPALLNVLHESLLARVCLLRTQVAGLAFTTSRERLARCLLDLAHTYGKPRGSGVLIPIAFTQTDFANMASMSRVTAAKIYAHLRDLGIISKGRVGFYIHDLELLAQLSGR